MIRSLHDNKGTIGYLGKCTTRRTILVTASSLSLVVNKPNYYAILFTWKAHDSKFALN